MNRKNIEKLIVWLTGALVISTIGGPILGEYSKSIIDSGNSSIPFGMSKGNFILQILYVKIFAQSLVNIVIAFWVFKTTTSKKLLLVIFSLLAGWWALPVFIYHQFFTKDAHNELLLQKTD